MAPHQYKLTYFNFRGLAEPIRYLFKYGNVEFEDIRLDFDKDWPKIKPTTPFGVVPLLEIDGSAVYGESVAITRYVGNVVGLGGKTDLENLKIDSTVDSHMDFILKMIRAYREQNQEKLNKAKTEELEFYYSRFEERVKKNGGYLALDRLTWADVMLAAHSPLIKAFLDVDLGDKYPNLGKLIKEVENNPGIKKWIEIRPPSAR